MAPPVRVLLALLLCLPLALTVAPGESSTAGAQEARARCVAKDLPDPKFRDSNCDGIDGQVKAARFVSPKGKDKNPCSRAKPCRTIQRGIAKAKKMGKRDVYVAGGSYQAFAVKDGVNVYGGFGRNFQRDPHKARGTRLAVVSGALKPVDGQLVTVLAEGVAHRTTLADLRIVGADATQPGQSTSVLVAHTSTLRLQRLDLRAGDGAPGVAGADGADAASLAPPAPGGTGGDGNEVSLACDDTSRGLGGPGATNTTESSSTVAMGGGAGGSGGTMDTSCGNPLNQDLNARAGDAGSPAVTNPAGPPGDGGPGGSGTEACGPAQPGQPGLVTNGAGGTAPPSAAGQVVAGWWQPLLGTAGSLGENGTGGGGGGGGGGCDQGTDAWGAGGGGGGAGGAAALGAGGPGGGGGGSFVIVAVGSTITGGGLALTPGTGGDGGIGGTGGQGQPGGVGGAGGLHPGSTEPGSGGNGAHGGHGGGGAGGAGGPSIAVLLLDSVMKAGRTVAEVGAPGAGGPGGESAPATLGGPDDDGLDGESGPEGVLAALLTCASAESC